MEQDIKQMVIMARRDPNAWHSIKEYRKARGDFQEKIMQRMIVGKSATTEEAIVEYFVTPSEGIHAPFGETDDELREGMAYREALPSSTTLYTQSSSLETPSSNSRA